MNERALKVLLIDDDLEDICLFEEALAELEEVQFSRDWLQPCELLQADDLSEALEITAEISVDIALVDLSLSDGHGLHAFRRLQELAAETPLVVLADSEDEAQALSLVRQGAQGYLVKSEVDCIPLARTIRGAIERQRHRSAMRSLVLIDDLTGLYSDAGLRKLAALQKSFAQRLGEGLWIHLFEIDRLDQLRDTHGAQERDMVLILISDLLRSSFGETDILARTDSNRFACLSAGPPRDPDPANRFMGALERENRRRDEASQLVLIQASVAGDAGMDVHDLLAAASGALCENRRSRLPV